MLQYRGWEGAVDGRMDDELSKKKNIWFSEDEEI